MSTWAQWLAERSAARTEAGLVRALHPRGAEDEVTDLAGNDYLGLVGHPAVRRAAADAALTWGAGAGASRLVTGTLTLHAELESALATWLGQPGAVVASTGYQANLALVGALADAETRVVSDAHIHASLIDAVRLSRAGVGVVGHNDLGAVRDELVRHRGRRTLVLAESVYSVLGDRAPLAELAELCAEHDALLVVDEAHALGVHGPGLVAEQGLAGQPHVLVTATLSKALGSQGGAVLGDPAVLDQLVNTARPFIFDTGLAPAAAGGALAALRLVAEQPDLGALVRRRAAELAHVLGVAPPAGAVLSVPMPGPEQALAAQAACRDAGVRVGCFRPPSTPDGVSRLRVTASAAPEQDAWDHAVEVLRGVVTDQPVGTGAAPLGHR